MAKAEAEAPTEFDAPLAEAVKTDAKWSPTMLTGVGVVTLFVALSIIIFMATRLTTCMYLDGSSN